MLSGWDHWHDHNPNLTTKQLGDPTNHSMTKPLWDGQGFSKMLESCISGYFHSADLQFETRNKPSTSIRHTKSWINLYHHVDFTQFEKKWPLSKSWFSTMQHWHFTKIKVFISGAALVSASVTTYPQQFIKAQWIYAINKSYTQKHTQTQKSGQAAS